MKRDFCLALMGLAVTLCLTAGALAGTVTLSFGSGSKAADVTFTSGLNTLIVTLTNTATNPAGGPGDVLTGVLFDYSGTKLTGSTSSAARVSGSNVVEWNGSAWASISDPGLNGAWAFRNDTPAFGKQYGIAASGLSPTFGPPNLFDPAHQVENSPGGANYGLIPSSLVQGTNRGNGNGLVNNDPYVQNAMMFTLAASGITTGMTNVALSSLLSDVQPLWGTSLSENTTVVPLPAAAWMGIGLMGSMGGLKWLRKRRDTLV